MTSASTSFPLGVIEGFFGRPWSWRDRADYAEFLNRYAFGFYIYAPKSDQLLRKHWRESWSPADWSELQGLRKVYAEHSVSFGVGLTPYGLQHAYTPGDASRLAEKVRQINSLEPDILAVLFDDIPLVSTGLAAIQATIVGDALAVSSAGSHFVCPTYYSDDPVLTKALGPMPENYLQDLGEQLPASVEVFWTGPKVCSETYSLEHLLDVTARLGRKPFIWDNYPVNDGPRMCKHLHLRPPKQRKSLLEGSSGLAANPMNQPELSKIALACLASMMQDPSQYCADDALTAAVSTLDNPALARALLDDIQQFHEWGRSTFSADNTEAYLEKYGRWDDPAAKEVVAWLRGSFEPDAALLAEFEEFAQQQSE